jgi:ATP-dependent Clp protease ATP-binding subunit ClpC
MFERYTEKARRVVFFSRYEASRYGSVVITTEHLLLGLLREEKNIFQGLLSDFESVIRLEQELRTQEEKRVSKHKVSTSVDLPLDNPAKRVLAYAAEEAARLNDRHIGTEHLLLGLLREPSVAAEALQANGIDLVKTREKLRLEARGSAETTQRQPLQRIVHDVYVEFVDDASQAMIAVVAPPGIVPAVGEEVLFGSRTFRVLKASHIYPETAALEGLSHATPRIRIYLQAVAEQT